MNSPELENVLQIEKLREVSKELNAIIREFDLSIRRVTLAVESLSYTLSRIEKSQEATPILLGGPTVGC